MKQILFLFLLTLLPSLGVRALDDRITYYTKIGGIYYHLVPNDYKYGNCAYVAPEHVLVGWNTVYSSGHYSGDVVIPESVVSDGTSYKVIGIISGAFNGCSIDRLVIPESVTMIAHNVGGDSIGTLCIGSWAWWNSVDPFDELNGNVTEDDYERVSDNLLAIAQHVVVGGVEYDMEDFKMPEGITDIRPCAFRHCPQIKSIAFTGDVRSVGSYAFFDCDGLEAVTIPDHVRKIGKKSFAECENVKAVTTGDGLTVIPEKAFYGCGMEEITIGRSVRAMEGGQCFVGSWTTQQTKVVITNLAAWCENLSTMNFKQYGLHLFSDSGTEITDLTVPEGVTSIHENCFFNLKSLKTVTMPSSVESIGGHAFYGCENLREVTIGDGILEPIGDNAFEGCEALQVVVSRSRKPWPLGEGMFPASVYRNAKLYVPKGAMGLYSRLDGWREFLDIVEMEDDDAPTTKGECAQPTIVVMGNKFKFQCDTPGASFTSTLATEESFTGDVVTIGSGETTCVLTVYATAPGYERSKPATYRFTGSRNDVNGDGTVDVADISTIISTMAGLPTE